MLSALVVRKAQNLCLRLRNRLALLSVLMDTWDEDTMDLPKLPLRANFGDDDILKLAEVEKRKEESGGTDSEVVVFRPSAVPAELDKSDFSITNVQLPRLELPSNESPQMTETSTDKTLRVDEKTPNSNVETPGKVESLEQSAGSKEPILSLGFPSGPRDSLTEADSEHKIPFEGFKFAVEAPPSPVVLDYNEAVKEAMGSPKRVPKSGKTVIHAKRAPRLPNTQRSKASSYPGVDEAMVKRISVLEETVEELQSTVIQMKAEINSLNSGINDRFEEFQRMVSHMIAGKTFTPPSAALEPLKPGEVVLTAENAKETLAHFGSNRLTMIRVDPTEQVTAKKPRAPGRKKLSAREIMIKRLEEK